MGTSRDQDVAFNEDATGFISCRFSIGQWGSRIRTEDVEVRVSHYRKRTEKEQPEGREEDEDATDGGLSTETGQVWQTKWR